MDSAPLARYFASQEMGVSMTKLVYLINGPNLNLLGTRQPELYGSATLADIEAGCAKRADELGLGLRCFQSNSEGQIVDWIQEARGDADAIILNSGAYSHTSIAVLDALIAFDGPVIEVHMSNIHAREAFRRHSYVSRRADAVIAGCGADGYEFALLRVATLLGQ